MKSGSRVTFIIIGIFFIATLSCQKQAVVALQLAGKTMGTTYHITYFDSQARNFQYSIDSLLVVLNKSINTYDSLSEISIFNQSTRSLTFKSPYFFPPLEKSRVVFVGSSGAYDPTVMPLVNAWGFGPRKIISPDTSEIMSLLKFVGFDKIEFTKDSVWKDDPNVQLDFGGIGQGYGADVIADFFKSKSITNFFVELGGEGVAYGTNLEKNRPWQIGILDPTSEEIESKFIAYASVNNEGYTTSGNYYNRRQASGKSYSHTIDPHTGFPVENGMISATVFAKECAIADAWATAFMAMGHGKVIEIQKSHPELKFFLVYSSADRIEKYCSENLKESLGIE